MIPTQTHPSLIRGCFQLHCNGLHSHNTVITVESPRECTLKVVCLAIMSYAKFGLLQL